MITQKTSWGGGVEYASPDIKEITLRPSRIVCASAKSASFEDWQEENL